jgi:hypothetical protein
VDKIAIQTVQTRQAGWYCCYCPLCTEYNAVFVQKHRSERLAIDAKISAATSAFSKNPQPSLYSILFDSTRGKILLHAWSCDTRFYYRC